MEHRQDKWSEEDLNILISLCNKGVTTHEIYKKYNGILNRSEASIQSRIYMLRKSGRITGPKKWNEWTEQQSDLFVELIKQGLTEEEIYLNYNQELGNRTRGALHTRFLILKRAEEDKENDEEFKETSFVEGPLFADEEITNKQQKAINAICYKLGIEFTGKTKSDAQKFIAENKSKSYAIGNKQFDEKIEPIVSQEITPNLSISNSIVDAIKENTETMSKGFDAMVRGMMEIKALLLDLSSSNKEIVKDSEDIQKRINQIQRYGITVSAIQGGNKQ